MLCEAMRSWKACRTITLNNCNIGDAGFRALAVELADQASLPRLGQEKNNVAAGLYLANGRNLGWEPNHASEQAKETLRAALGDRVEVLRSI